MSTTSPNASPALKRLTCCVASVLAAVLLLLPQTRDTLSLRTLPVHAATLPLQPTGPPIPSPATPLPTQAHFWHTDGNRILDTHNRAVRISGMNWSGFETRQAVPGGLKTRDYRAVLRTIKQNGYNTVRIPFSNEMIEMPSVPEDISFSGVNGPMNTDLQNLTSIEILDKIVAYSGQIGLKIILDNHRSEAGTSAQESGLWYTSKFPESAWIADWTALALRYHNESAVIGMDLRNEPHNADKGGACWDCGGANDWHRAAQRAGNAILAVNPRLLIFVEGVDSYAGDSYWWGGNLEGVRRSPVHLSVPDHLVYSAHEYGPTEYAQPWFNTSTNSAILVSTWRRHWAYISEAGIAPVWIGEFGTPNNDDDVQSSAPGSEGQWFANLIDFLGSHPALGWTYWGINGEDRYGLLDSEYSTDPSNQLKAEVLRSVQSDRATEDTHGFGVDPSLSPSTSPRSVLASRKSSASTSIALGDSPFISKKAFVAPKLITTRPLTPSLGFSIANVSAPIDQSDIAASIHSAVLAANQHVSERRGVVAR